MSCHGYCEKCYKNKVTGRNVFCDDCKESNSMVVMEKENKYDNVPRCPSCKSDNVSESFKNGYSIHCSDCGYRNLEVV